MGLDAGYGIGSLKPGVCTSSTRPASPFDGQVIYMTDVDQTAVWDGTQWTVLAPIAGGRNRIINGAFDVWQRGTSFTLANNTDTYTADRWMNWFNGSSNGTQTASRQTHTVGQTDVPGNPTYFFRWTGTTLGTGQTVIDLRQRIENVAIGAGQTVTFTYYAKSSSALASGSVSIFFSQNFGSGGSSTVDTTATLSATNITTGWVRYIATATLPSISGKTVGTSNYLQVLMRFSNIVNGLSIDVSNAQLEAGAVATPFEFEDYGTTLLKCKRYYWRNAIYAGGGVGGGGTIPIVSIQFPVTMRTTPTFGYISNGPTMNGLADETINGLWSGLPSRDTTTDGTELLFTKTGAAWTSGQGITVKNVVIEVRAEL